MGPEPGKARDRGAIRARASAAGALRHADEDQIEKEVPQPQEEVALGLSTTKRAPISSSV